MHAKKCDYYAELDNGCPPPHGRMDGMNTAFNISTNNTNNGKRHHPGPGAMPPEFETFENSFDPGTGTLRFDGTDKDCTVDFPFQIPPAALENIREIKAYCADFVSIPEAVFSCENARILFFSLCNIETVPDAIGDLRQLEYLELSDCPIREISARVGELKQLKQLYLRDNHLQTVPASLGDCLNLTSLTLTNNRLARLPETFAALSKLEHLGLDGNPLTELPWFALQLPALKTLSCDNHCINPMEARRFAAACAGRNVQLAWNRHIYHV